MQITRRYEAWVLLTGAVVAALLLVIAPLVPQWGELHPPHDDEKFLRLRTGEAVSQSFVLEHGSPDAVLLWFDPARLPQSDGDLSLAVVSNDRGIAKELSAGDIQADGLGAWQFTDKLRSRTGRVAQLTLTNQGSEPVYVNYQIDSSIYADGELTYHPNTRKVGDLAWRVRYQRPAVGSIGLQLLYVVGLLAAGLISFVVLARAREATSFFAKRDRLIAAALLLVVTLAYGPLLIRPGIWIGPSDFTKDVSYIESSSAAVQAGQWPAWSHVTCGGMGLVGNPENNTLSLTTLVGLVTSGELALFLVLALEAGIAAAGVYLLARALKFSTSASILAVVVATLSGSFIYKIALGFGMIGGAMAFTPWVLLALVRAFEGSERRWITIGGLGLIGIFWRGDVHVILGLLLVLIAWAAVTAWRGRKWRPVLVLLGMLAIFFLGASVKALPYLEQPNLISSEVTPSAVLVTATRTWDDMFLQQVDPLASATITHGYKEPFGYQGAYLGFVATVLVLLGLFYRHRYRWHIIVAVAILLLLIEGSLYEVVLRHIPPLDALLRMPGRLTIALAPLAGLLAAGGLEWLRHRVSKAMVLSAAIILLVIIELGLGVLFVTDAAGLGRRTDVLPEAPAAPALAAHVNEPMNDRWHASQLLASGYLLPQVCGDQNNPPLFTTAIEDTALVSEQPISLTPGEITFAAAEGTRPQVVDERFVSAWQSNEVLIVPADNGGMRVLTDERTVRLRYHSASVRAQQILFISILIAGIMSIKNSFAKLSR